ncbi:ABC transporter permease [Rasiella sp. SM2506]|uniref:ABC transporter permease n=1 Tax=Rasiella sp. SM2506 TaxID=3423914 RepID=UPI003D7C012E
MFKTNLKIAWRNIHKNKGMFAINIIGLSFGIATCLLISLFVFDELSYDRYNEKADRMVRVVFNATINGEQMKEAVTMAPVSAAFIEDIPEVLDGTRIDKLYNPKLTYNNTSYRNSKFAYVDPNFFEVFTLPIVKGDALTPLAKPNTIVITTKEAEKYFGNEDPIGKQLVLERNGDHRFTVTALIDEVPSNSHFHFNIFASTEGYAPAKSTSWTDSGFFNYLVLKEGTDLAAVQKKVPALIEKYMGPQIKTEIGISYAEFTSKNKVNLVLQPLTDIHLKSNFTATSQIEQGGDIKTVYIFTAIAIFMLLIACINFMNLSTASASKRAKEVGIRKVLGSTRKRLIIQFMVEAFMATVIAVVLAIGIFMIAFPIFNELAGERLNIAYLLKPQIILILVGFLIFIPFLAGGYPAFFLSSFKPIKAIKSKFSGSGNNNLRSGLVIFQFIISALLIVATLVVEQQMQFIQQKDLGYDKDQLLVLRDAYLLGNDIDALRNELLADARVSQITQSAYTPAGNSDVSMSGIFLNDQFLRRMFTYDIDDQYIPTMNMELVSGRNFSKDFGIEDDKVIINETARKALGFGNDAVGEVFVRDTNDGKKELTIIGVVKDFHFKSLKQEVEPLIMLNNPYGGLIVKVRSKDMSGLIEMANTTWLHYNAKEVFDYFILDDAFNETYVSERKMGYTLTLFAGLTIFVACLGLFGLVTYTAERRIKEIGIRKVLGSSVSQIVTLLSKEFLKLVMIAFIIAFPLAYYIMKNWLQDFAYRIDLSPWVFVSSALITMFIAFLTVGIKGIQAASVNPIKSLKTE